MAILASLIGGLVAFLFGRRGDSESPKALPSVTPPTVARWRTLADAMRGDIPLEFILAWITHESGGNPCAVGTPGVTDADGQVLESGLFQLYSPGNISAAGTTVEKMRRGCGPVSKDRKVTQACLRDLTPDEMREHMRAGLQYINHARKTASAILANNHVDWHRQDKDFWRFVKLIHALPGLAKAVKQVSAKLGHAPRDWAEYRQTVMTLNFNEFDKGTARYTLSPRGSKPTGSEDRFIAVLNNAEKTGGAVQEKGFV